MPQAGVLVIALALILLVRAVTDDDAPTSPTGADQTTSTNATSEADAPTSSTTLVTARPELRAVLLTSADLPAGWVATPVGEFSELCAGSDPLAQVVPRERAEVGYAHEAASLTVVNAVLDYPSTARARTLLDEVRNALDRCGDVETEGGIFQLEEATIDDLGDEVVGVHLTGDTAVGAVEAHLLYIRVGARVTTLALVGLGDVDEDIVRDAAERVVARL